MQQPNHEKKPKNIISRFCKFKLLSILERSRLIDKLLEDTGDHWRKLENINLEDEPKL